jgi:phosphate starvation-inducible membrane PsiE
MPVRFLIYVAITALTRLLLEDIQLQHKPDLGILIVAGAILLLALANLVVRYGSARFPSGARPGP